MKPSALVIVLPIFVCGCATGSSKPSSPAGEKVERISVEFRRAEMMPGPGLKEASLETMLGRRAVIYLHPQVELSNADIESARLTRGRGGQTSIAFHLTSRGEAKMRRLSRQMINKPLALLIDGKVVSVPVVKEEVGSPVTIEGVFSEEEVRRIVTGLK